MEVTVIDKVFNLVIQVKALLSVVTIVMVKMAVAPVVASVLNSSPHRVGGLKESSLSDLEEDLSPSRVEWSVEESGDNLLVGV
ncbi:hypothetical protein B296_00048853 [Ensete ventricosum]|uniref:Uncharacterized protein n=1 Tax=Ensete ventricosum TaxID=4639 RepID=A0A426XBU7_ENSVE|nr:hypothetical protein B296_00048853 [Ensete ventricosum]